MDVLKEKIVLKISNGGEVVFVSQAMKWCWVWYTAQILLDCLLRHLILPVVFFFFSDIHHVPGQSVCLPKLMVLNSSLLISLGKASLDLDVLYRSTVVHRHMQKSHIGGVEYTAMCRNHSWLFRWIWAVIFRRLLYLPVLDRQGTSIFCCQFLYRCNAKKPDLPS